MSLDLTPEHLWELHEQVFRHRHEYPFAPFHRDLVFDFWSPSWAYIDLGFRECGKTTMAEEDIVLSAALGTFRNCLIIGAKEELAGELLTNIKSEIDNNPAVHELFGEMHGSKWTGTKVELNTGACIQARGVGQTLRGTQHRNWRPDLVIVNDFEDDEEVLTPEGRRKRMRWVLKVLLPACDRRRRRIRIYDTVRDADSVPMQLIKTEKWPHRIIPILYLDEQGEEQSSWPGHPSLSMDWIRRERQTYRSLGEEDIWDREYMCDATTTADRTFKPEHIRVEPVPHTFQAKMAMIDPARTTGRSSSMTGWAVWSWERHRLIVWEAGAKHLMPDEIVDLAFRLAREHEPIDVGIEEDGLNEWLLQPIRQRMLRDGVIPYRAVRAPKGKLDFIRGLQPFFSAGEVTLCQEMPELREQLLSFPTGKIDAPNALAYALLLRPGRLIYDGWLSAQHIIPPSSGTTYVREYSLALNATRTLVTGSLVASVDGRVVVVGDFVQEGDPGETAERILREASIRSAGRLTVFAGPKHFDQWQNVGLAQALRAFGCDCRPGGSVEGGREFIRQELGRSSAGVPSFGVSPDATWTLRAFAGGYARDVRRGELAQEAEDNRYKTLMEGLESFCGLFAWQNQDEQNRNWAYDKTGRRYLSAMPSVSHA